MSHRSSVNDIYTIEGMPPEHEPEPDYEATDGGGGGGEQSEWSQTGPESSVSHADHVSSVSEVSVHYEQAKQKEYKQKLIISLAMLLPAVAAIIGVMAWAITAEAIMADKRQHGLRRPELNAKLPNHYDINHFQPAANNLLPLKEMLVDPAGQLNGGNGLTTDLLRQHIESIGEISKRMDNEEESSDGSALSADATGGKASTSAAAAATVGGSSQADQHMSAITEKFKKTLTSASIAKLFEKLLANQQQQQPKDVGDEGGKTSHAKHPTAKGTEETIKTSVTTTKPKALDLKVANNEKKDTEANKANKGRPKKKMATTTTPVTTSGKKKTADRRPQKAGNSATTTTGKTLKGNNKNVKAKIYEKEIDLLLQKIEKLEKQKKVEVKAPASVEKAITPDVADKIKQFMNIESDDANKKDQPAAPGSLEEWQQQQQQQAAAGMPPMPPPHFGMPPFMPFMPPMPPMQQFEPPQPEGDAQHGYPLPPPAEQVDPRSRGPMEQVAPPMPQQLQHDYMQQQASGAQPQHTLYPVAANGQDAAVPPQYGQAQDYNPVETYQQQPQQQQQQQPVEYQQMAAVPGNYQHAPAAPVGYQQQAPSAQTYPNTYSYGEPQEPSKKSLFRRKFKLSNILNSVMPKSRKKKEEEGRKMAAAIAAAAAAQQQSNQVLDGRRYPVQPQGPGGDQVVQESQNYNYVDRGQYTQYEKPGMQLSLGAGPMGGGSQFKVSPMGILKTLVLPLLPKPRMNLNGKVVFGVVLENGVGFGKKPKTVFQHYSTGRLRR